MSVPRIVLPFLRIRLNWLDGTDAEHGLLHARSTPPVVAHLSSNQPPSSGAYQQGTPVVTGS